MGPVLVSNISTFLKEFDLDLSKLNCFLIDGQLSILEGYILDCMVEGCMVERFVIIFIVFQARL